MGSSKKLTSSKDLQEQVLKLKKQVEVKDKEIDKLSKVVAYDSLTGLLNRFGFKKEVDKFIESIKKESTLTSKNLNRRILINNMTFIFIDLNDFKLINDKYGHDAGDRALIDFSNILERAVRDIDLVARWSGDEFVISLIGSNKEQAEDKISKIKDLLDEYNRDSGGIKLSASFGVASVKDDLRDQEVVFDLNKLIKEADEKMYKDKVSLRGGNLDKRKKEGFFSKILKKFDF